MPLYTDQNSHHKQINKQALERLWIKGNPSVLLVGVHTRISSPNSFMWQTGATTVENSMEFPQKTKNGTVF